MDLLADDDTTLLNLIKLGSVDLRAKGYTRTGTESVVGDMPGFGSSVSDGRNPEDARLHPFEGVERFAIASASH